MKGDIQMGEVIEMVRSMAAKARQQIEQEAQLTDTERRYGHYHPKRTPGEVRVGTWGYQRRIDEKGNVYRAPGYVGFHYFDGPDAEERALDYADQLMRDRKQAPEARYPGDGDVEAVCFDAYIGDYVTPALRESAKESLGAA